MKKFLTVLLALSVVFTYTVGTAFAVEGVDKTPITNAQAAGNTAIDEAAKALLNQFTFDKDGNLTAFYQAGAKVTLTTDGSVDATDEQVSYVTKAVVQTAVNDAAEKAKKDLQNYVTTQDSGVTTEDDVKTAVTNIQGKTQEFINALTVLGTGYSLADLAIAQEKVTKAAAVAELGAYTTSQYSDDTDLWAIAQNGTYAGKYSVATVAGISAPDTTPMSAKAFVSSVIKTQTAAVNGATGDAFAKIKAYNDALKIASDIIKGYKDTNPANYIPAVPTAEELNSDKTVDNAKVAAIEKMEAALKSKAVELRQDLQEVIDDQNKVSKPDTDKVAAYQAALSGLDAQIAAAKEVYTAKINAQKTIPDVNSTYTTIKDEIDNLAFTYADKTCTSTVLDKYTQTAKDVATLRAYADEIIALVDRDANPYFDESAVKDVLAKQIEKLYDGSTNLTAAKAAIKTAAAVKDGLLELRSKFIANVEGEGTDIAIGTKTYKTWAGEDAYEEAQLKAYKDNVEKTVKAINDATTYDAIKEAYLAGVKANENIITIAQHAKDWAATGDLKVVYDKSYKADMDAYVAYAKAKLSASDYSKVKAADVSGKIDEIVQKAYTKEEIPTQVAAAKAYLDGLKSDKELAEAKKSVEAMISAIKAPVTIDAKDQILDAKKAYEDYMDLVGVDAPNNELALQNSVKSLATLDLKAITDDIAALKKTGVTVADAEKIDAIGKAIAAYKANYEAELAATPAKVGTTTAAETALKGLKKDLSDAQLENVAKLCAALPINPTSNEDLEKIAAAKAAFDALDIHQKAEFVDKYDLYYDKLSQVEGSLKTAVEALKITASSTAGKGYIKVKWTVKGVAAAADGYQVYRSVKRNSGYGTKPYFTTKAGATTYKNTKALKKGKRYFYKVRAFKVVDGKKIYSDWSNKAYRIAK